MVNDFEVEIFAAKHAQAIVPKERCQGPLKRYLKPYEKPTAKWLAKK